MQEVIGTNMGMFDYVDYTCKCPKCGAEVTGFQTKSGECTLSTISPEKAGYFYSSCEECDAWIEGETVVKDYQVIIKVREDK